jgi:hypothetical protein
MESQEYLLINDEAERGVFYKKTYLHVALSILAFIVLESLLIKLVPYDFIVWMVSGKFYLVISSRLLLVRSIAFFQMDLSPKPTDSVYGPGFLYRIGGRYFPTDDFLLLQR